MHLIEVKMLAELCRIVDGAKNIHAALAPWDDDGYVLLFRTNTDKKFILRTAAAPIPRVFKSVTTALNLCKEVGLTSVMVTFAGQNFDYAKPAWLQSDSAPQAADQRE